MKTVHLDHISYSVSDYKRSAAFYQSLMGWEIANDNGENQATLKIGNVGEIIIRNQRRPAGAAPAAAPAAAGQAERPPITGVINHVSWGIEPWDTEGVKAELEKRGLKPRRRHGGRRLQELARARSRRMGSADQQPDEVASRAPWTRSRGWHGSSARDARSPVEGRAIVLAAASVSRRLEPRTTAPSPKPQASRPQSQ